MPQGQPLTVPDDGLTTRARRSTPVLAVHTGPGKGKSTAAFGMALRAWNAGLDVAVFQFVKSAKWKVGEESAFAHLGRLHAEQGVGGPVEWHKMGAGWSWARPARHSDQARPARHSDQARPARHSDQARPARHSDQARPARHSDQARPARHSDQARPARHSDQARAGGSEAGSEDDHAATAAAGWAEIARRIAEQRHDFYVLDEFTYPLKWGWVDLDEVLTALRDRPGRQHVVITGRDAPQQLLDAADLVTEMTKVKHPMDAGRKGQRGIEW